MKKKIILLLVVLAILLCLALSVSAEEAGGYIYDSDVIWTYTDGVLDLSGNGELSYWSLGMPWDNYKDSIETIVINPGITSINSGAFEEYPNLKYVEFTHTDYFAISPNAFVECPNLTNVKYEGSRNDWHERVYVGLPNDTLLSADFTFLGDPANQPIEHSFDINEDYCTCGIKFNSYSNTIKYHFDSFTGTLTVFGTGKMKDHPSGDNNTWLSSLNNGLKHVVILEGITSVGDRAFMWLSELESISLPDSLVSIGKLAFCYDAKLSSISMGKNVNSIGHWAFQHCYSLESINVDHENSNLYDIDGILYKKGANGDILLKCPCGTKLTEVVIPENVIELEDASFHNTGIKNITLPVGLTEIKDETFYGCESLESITIPEGVTSIGENAFNYCFSLKSVIFPKSLESIGFCSFSLCRELTEVKIPQNVTSIGDSAFFGCEAIVNVFLPDSLMEMGASMFDGCPTIRNISIPSGTNTIPSQMFQSCSSLETVVIPSSINTIEQAAFAKCDSLSTVTYIGNEEQWDDMTIEGENEALYGANIVFLGDNNIDAFNVFKDLKKNTWSKDAINFVVSHNYMSGTSTNKFSQTGTMTRAMIVSVLWRIAGQPVPTVENPFEDLDPKQTWYHSAAVWAYERGIVAGTTPTTFSPNGAVTREQLASFLYRYAQFKGYDTSATTDISSFPDSGKVGSWAKNAMSWANATGLIAGSMDSNKVIHLDPQGKATREQVATILMRFCNAYNINK